jgi:hypothetical protein
MPARIRILRPVGARQSFNKVLLGKLVFRHYAGRGRSGGLILVCRVLR